MTRLVVVLGIAMLISALAGAGSSFVEPESVAGVSCSEAQPESSVRAGVVSVPPTAHSKFVAPEALHRIPAGARIVDIRRSSRHSRWKPERALAMSFLELRVLAVRAAHPVYVFGSGYDDDRIVRRIARWKPSEAEWVRVIRHGAAGFAMAYSESIDRSEMMHLLKVPVRQVAGVASHGKGVFVWIGSSPVPEKLQNSLDGFDDAQLKSASEVTEWARLQTSEFDAKIFLAGDDPARVGEAAIDASVALGRPVFYIDGRRAEIAEQMNHHARLVQGRQRVGGVPCG